MNKQPRTAKVERVESDDSDRDLYKSIGRRYTNSKSNHPARILNFYKQKKLDYDADLKDEVNYMYSNAKFQNYKKELREQETRNSSPTRKFNEFYKQYSDKQRRSLIGKSPDGKKGYDYSS